MENKKCLKPPTRKNGTVHHQNPHKVIKHLGFPVKNIVILDHQKVGKSTIEFTIEVHHDLTINNGDLTMGI